MEDLPVLRSFREKYRLTLERLNQDLIRRFGMDLEIFAAKLTPKENPGENDPRFDWHLDEPPDEPEVRAGNPQVSTEN